MMKFPGIKEMDLVCERLRINNSKKNDNKNIINNINNNNNDNIIINYFKLYLLYVIFCKKAM